MNEIINKEPVQRVIKALNKGKAVYVEKPLALDMQSITDIEESIYRSENPKLFIGFNRRFSKSAQFIKQKLINNKLDNKIVPK